MGYKEGFIKDRLSIYKESEDLAKCRTLQKESEIVSACNNNGSQYRIEKNK